MGIDAQCFSPQMPKGRFFRLSGRKALASIAASAKTWAAEQNLGPLFQIDQRGDGALVVQLIPVADPIYFEANKTGLSAGFRSSNGGPGLHAACVDLLDHIAQDLGITWHWTASDGSDLDETGYARHRDFTALQASMAEFLHNNVHMSLQMQGDTKSISLCLPVGLGQIENQTCAPLGIMPQDWAENLAAAEAPTLARASKEFFIWWDQSLPPATWQNLLRAQLWQNAEWNSFDTNDARLARKQIAHCVARLKALGAPVQPDLAEAFAEYQRHQDSDDAPKPTGIGYRKRLISGQVYESWSMKRPGYLQFADNDGAASWQHPAFWLGTQSFVIETEGKGFEYPEKFTEPEFEIRPGLKCRKNPLPTQDGTSVVQGAFCVAEKDGKHHVLTLTLASHLDWPFNEFDTWINSVVFSNHPVTSIVAHMN